MRFRISHFFIMDESEIIEEIISSINEEGWKDISQIYAIILYFKRPKPKTLMLGNILESLDITQNISKQLLLQLAKFPHYIFDILNTPLLKDSELFSQNINYVMELLKVISIHSKKSIRNFVVGLVEGYDPSQFT